MALKTIDTLPSENSTDVKSPKRARSQAVQDATRIPTAREYAGPATTHVLRRGDMETRLIPDQSVHLVVTSPPYFNLKRYNEEHGQLGNINELEEFLEGLDSVWRHCYRTLVPGGRLVCNIGDVCVSRRKNSGRHMVVPLHAHIAVRAQKIGFDYLTPIL